MKKLTSKVIKVLVPFKKKVKNFKLDSKKYTFKKYKKNFLVEVKVPHFLEEGYRNIEIFNQIDTIGKEMMETMVGIVNKRNNKNNK